MDGLIDQAKAHLWNMVSTMGQVRCEGLAPSFELALYEYGRPSSGESNGFIKQLHPFTSNLDQGSSTLFSLSTYSGDEYCPQVIIAAWPGTVEKVKKGFTQVKQVVPGHGVYGDNGLLDYTIGLFGGKEGKF